MEDDGSFEAGDSLDGESRHDHEASEGARDDEEVAEVSFPSPDEILERQRGRYANRFRRKADAPPVKRRKRGEPFDPPPAWTQAFREQCTRETRDKAKKYAYSVRDWLERMGVAVAGDWVDEQVHKAIGDTLDGRIRWRVDKVELVNHLKDTIRARAWKLAERSKRFREVSLDQGQDDDHIEAEVDERPNEIEASLEIGHGRSERDQLAASDFVAKIVAGARALSEAEGDDEARQIHDAYDLGIVDKAEVCAHTGMSEDTFHNARRRVARRAKRVAAQLRGGREGDES